MKNTIVILYFLSICSLAMEKVDIHNNFNNKIKKHLHGIRKVNNDLYSTKSKDGYYLTMQRIKKDNIDNWIEFADNQVSEGEQRDLKYLPNIDGSIHFKFVLQEYKSGTIINENEVWVAYTSTLPTSKNTLQNKKHSIEMFMSVITSPQALLTSHMGISRTWENALKLQKNPPEATKHPYQSMVLQSFAAKVMKLQNPKKEYMITTPTPLMRTIFIKKMPQNTIFIGDNLYAQKIKNAIRDPLTLVGKNRLQKNMGQQQLARSEKIAMESFERWNIKEKAEQLKTNPPRITITQNETNKTFFIKGLSKQQNIEFNQNTTIYQWLFTEPYLPMGIIIPYVLIDLEALVEIKK